MLSYRLPLVWWTLAEESSDNWWGKGESRLGAVWDAGRQQEDRNLGGGVCVGFAVVRFGGEAARDALRRELEKISRGWDGRRLQRAPTGSNGAEITRRKKLQTAEIFPVMLKLGFHRASLTKIFSRIVTTSSSTRWQKQQQKMLRIQYLSIAENRYTNPRGIPRAPFVDKVEEFVTSPEEINATLRKFDEMLSYVSLVH